MYLCSIHYFVKFVYIQTLNSAPDPQITNPEKQDLIIV